MLSKLLEGMGARNSENLKAGFPACGIFPVNADVVLKKFPSCSDTDNNTCASHTIPLSDAVLEYLHQIKYSPSSKPQRKQKQPRLSVAPGKSVSAEDLQKTSTNSTELAATTRKPAAPKSSSTSSTGTANL
ncbi:tigger transposable element-derived protein 2 [Plakobranchus ocellatus]|uniref:Tigger transposable element-derived protein 2 n=1 Tax=Plakobranchus ocellatus TaxID=259542 RepID=A0AAV4BG06_9GAST|nr:tigger transposable element-derived protein 2 [Plakobranchus ocellatus]